ncbi:MAG: SDR family NAD(P)-dependent oxidoreductase [Betaproteobacteria bacterium]|jgi:NADP-dependent 3-hydroxy acid dehydrogenase YdfG|nr:SDR family NAD(P)-dependent oxidoreductase [Betaproteobacteria bacterium]
MTALKGKVAWITGGGSGIGLAGAVSLAREGAHVVISGRTKSSLDSGLAEAKKAGSAEALLLDVADREAVLRVAADIEKRHGRIDILVTSAGTNISGAKRNLATMSLEGWDDVVRINLDGLFYCCYAVIPGMRKRKDGLIVNISSWAGRYASMLTGPAYNATKRGVIAITESINMEECGNGIRATSILPGEVATPIMAKRPVPPSPERMAEMVQAEDLGETILYLAKMPPRTCVNELIISPTRNRFYLGGLEAPKG